VPFLVTARIETENNFAGLRKAVELRVNEALVQWGALALEEIRSETPIGDDPRGPGPHFKKPNIAGDTHLIDSFRSEVVRSALTGFATIVVWTPHPAAIWLELGTRGRRKRQLKGVGGFNATDGNAGVRARYFMRHALQRAAPLGQALVQNALRGMGNFGGGSGRIDTASPDFFNTGASAYLHGSNAPRFRL
jgi:hypothetical protein